MSNELTTREAAPVAVVESHGDLMEVCKTIAASGLVPKNLSKPEQVYVAILTGREAGLSNLASVRSVYVINGTPSWKGEAALALIRKSGLARSLEVGAEKVGDTDEDARGFVRWLDVEGNAREVVYSTADAKRAKLWGKAGPWSEHPKDMLIWRAVGRAGKRYFAEVLLGLDVSEVARDYVTQEPGADGAIRAETAPERDPLLEQLTAPVEAEVSDAEIVEPGGPAEAAGDPSELTPEEEFELKPPPPSAEE